MIKKIINSKVKVFTIVLFLFLVFQIFISSFTVGEPDAYDELLTYIKNSKGNCWEATAENIQEAINDLDNSSGTVFLPGSTVFITSSTIIVWNNVILDMGGSIVKPTGDFDVIDMRESSSLTNGRIDVSGVEDFHHACIVINGIHYIDTQENTTKIFNMELQSANQKGIGIYLHVDDDNQAIAWVRCNVLRTKSFKYGIYLHCDNNGDSQGSWINGNTFTDLRGCDDRFFIYITRNTEVSEPWSATGGNIFETMQYQTTVNTQCVIYNEGWQNMFSNLMLWDWHLAGAGKKSIEFTADSRYCFLSFRGGSDGVVDNGAKNTILDYGLSKLHIQSLDSIPNYVILQSLAENLSLIKIIAIIGSVILVLVGIIIFMKRKKR